MAKAKKKFTVSFDSPVTLVMVIVFIVMAIVERFVPSLSSFFTCPCKQNNFGAFNFRAVSDYFRIFLYPLGFGNWNLLASNLVFILLLGTKVEQVFGKLVTSVIILVTVVFAGVVNVCFSSAVIYGTSGIVCVLLILALYVSIDKKSIPLSLILLAVIYFAREIVLIIDGNSLQIFCHFAGALAGSLVGILSLSVGKK